MDLLCTRLSGLEPSGCSYWYSLVNVGYAGLFMKCPCTLACEYWELLKNQGSVAFNAFEGYRWRTQLLTRSKALGFGRSMLICCVNHQMKSRRGIELYFLLGHRLLIRLFQDGPRREGWPHFTNSEVYILARFHISKISVLLTVNHIS